LHVLLEKAKTVIILTAHQSSTVLLIFLQMEYLKNKWVIEFGIIACILIIPFALIAGAFRGMPFWWRLIDCSFGIIGVIPLSICLQKIKILEKEEKADEEKKQGYNFLIA
jgi:hypothetical protein